MRSDVDILQMSIGSDESFQLISCVNQKPTNSHTNPISPISFLASSSIYPDKINIVHYDEAFNGYNLFVLERRNSTDINDKCATLFITDMEGNVITSRKLKRNNFHLSDYNVEFINSTTILIRINSNLAFWNFYTNTTQIFDIQGGHHDFEYNPLTKTFLLMKKVYTTDSDGNSSRFDEILEYDEKGEVIWSLDTRSFILQSQWCLFNDRIGPKADVTHSNSIFWDFKEDMIFLNLRNTNTFYKIDHKTGEMIWGLGEYGDFTLFDKHGNERKNLFYHSHAVEKVDNNTFILFDNDLHNQTNTRNSRSRIVEIKIDETTMTAEEIWSWTAPEEYYSYYQGDADRLPNGNRLGTFGTPTHPNSKFGARLVEVNDGGEIVWEMSFENSDDYEYSVYRMERFRYSPISTDFSEITIPKGENLTIIWQTWYNFRSKMRFNGSYSLFLDNEKIEFGNHTYDKFWRPTDLTIELNNLKTGYHNLKLVLEDEEDHRSTNSIVIRVGIKNTSDAFPIDIFPLSLGFLCLVITIHFYRKRHRES